MEKPETEMEGDCFPRQSACPASLATRPVWDPGHPAMGTRGRCSGDRHCLACGCLLAVGLGRDLIRGAEEYSLPSALPPSPSRILDQHDPPPCLYPLPYPKAGLV